MYSNDCDFIDCYDVDPSELAHTNDYLEEQKCYNALWGAVILQAIVDATSDYKRTEYRIEKTRAASWLLEPNPDFIIVCHLSCYDPKYICKKASSIIKEHNKKLSKKHEKSDSYGIRTRVTTVKG